jgi:IrrE N-terminal-like domain
MGPWRRSPGVRVPARNTGEIRQIALRAREALGVEEPKVDMVHLLENRLRKQGIHFHLVEAEDIRGDVARAIPEQGKLLIVADAYSALHDDDPKHELLVPHELGHFALAHIKNAYFSKEDSWYSHNSLEDSETQADRFSHEFAMPVHLIRQHCRSLKAIQEIFNVPIDEARIRMEQLRQEHAIDW